MVTIDIADRLWFEETLLGATLHFQAGDGPDGVLFKVGISFSSLMACNQAMGSRHCEWQIRDGSLSVRGDNEELTLTFRSVAERRALAVVSLFGEEMKAFRYAINAFAFRRQALLN